MATINGIVTIGSIWGLNLASDPSASSGTVAPVGSFGAAIDGSGFYVKTGAGDTAWGKLVTNTSPVFITDITTPLIIGGTGVTSKIDYKSTTGNGTTTAAAHEFWGGNNGATNIAQLYNDGLVTIGTTSRPTIGQIRIVQGASAIELGEQSSGISALWLAASATTMTTSNYAVRVSSSITYINSSGSTGDVQLSYLGTTRYTFGARDLNFTPNIRTSGNGNVFTFTAPASTGLTASSEVNGFIYSLATNRQWSTGAITTQREFLISAPTYRFVGASVITTAATLAISGAPIASTNATITNSHALWIQSGQSHFDGDIEMGDGFNMVFNATTGTKIATATTQKMGFWGVTPIVQPASANQAALTNNTGGTYNGTLVDVGAVFSQANINDNFTDVFTLLNEIRTVLVNTGIMKGSS